MLLDHFPNHVMDAVQSMAVALLTRQHSALLKHPFSTARNNDGADTAGGNIV